MPDFAPPEFPRAPGWHGLTEPLKIHISRTLAIIRVAPELAAAAAMFSLWFAAFFILCLDFWLAAIWLGIWGAFRSRAVSDPPRPSAALEDWSEALGTIAALSFLGALASPSFPAGGSLLVLISFLAGSAWDRIRGTAAAEPWISPHVAWGTVLPRLVNLLPSPIRPPFRWPVPDWLRKLETAASAAASWCVLMGLVVQYGPRAGAICYGILMAGALATIAFGHWQSARKFRNTAPLPL